MLAHDGVYFPNIWTQWIDAMKEKNIDIIVGIVSNARVRHGKDFVQKYRLNVNVKTGWCEWGLVEAYREGVSELLQKNSDFTRVLFVSGSDIPIASAKTLRNNSEFSTIMFFDQEERESQVHSHSQWVQLNRTHAQRFVDNTTPEKMACAKQNFAKVRECPDEFFVGRVLLYDTQPKLELVEYDEAEGKDSAKCILRHSYTDAEYYCETYPSPIEWRSYDENIFVHTNDEEPDPATPNVFGYKRKSLNFILEEDYGQALLFFRKVRTLRGTASDFVKKNYPWLFQKEEEENIIDLTKD